ncbi:TonB-dependent receptor [Flammeovirga sp. MY04]|uniref:SusC/RagA family TonB-linked outer membrane protein n=1 Tax=Flammeovirga sp. MY04 TaxID=1191459 RepID=UPI00080634C4|nr:TonB-dependent receptor [Flammeovirga sp. MY04]ANQ52618.1 TonB-dependent receptor [Flammeovirga sp. MY04]
MIIKKRLFYLLLLMLCWGTSHAQERMVSGVITDQNKQPLPGTNVVEKGTSNGTITNTDGEFSLLLTTENPVLVFTFIGFLEQEITVGQQDQFVVRLEEDVDVLDDVVVIGYGTQKKENVTGAITKVGKDAIEGRPVADFQSALQGQVAGLQITGTDGQPGANPSIRIRGTGTITGGSDPLYVIDGVILQDGDAFSTINPSDIESVNVLKDASAGAIYGARAANGVIIITTKRGKAGAKPQFNVNIFGGPKMITNKLDMLNAQEYQQVMNSVSDNSGLPRIPRLDGTTLTTNTDWQDELFQTGYQQNYELSGSVSGKNGSIYASINHFDEKGTMINTGFTRTSMRINSDLTIKRFKFGNTISYTRSNYNLGYIGDRGPTFWALAYSPAVEVYNEDNLGGYNGMGKEDGDYNFIQPVATQNLLQRNRIINRVIASVYGEVEILHGLNFKTNLAADISNSHHKMFMPEFELNDTGKPPYLFSLGAELDEERSERTMWLWENTLNYKKSFGKHNIGLLAGYTMQHSRRNTMGVAVYGENLSESMSILNGSYLIKSDPSSPLFDKNTLSYIGRAIYDYDGKYMATVNFRRDGSSVFTKENRFSNFMSGSVGWLISKESFMANGPFDLLKVRASYGSLGNDQINDRATQPILDSKPRYVFNGESMVTAVAPDGQLFNNTLVWEKQVQTNIGIDGAVLKNKLSFTVDYFIKTSDDLLLDYALPHTTGHKNVYVNAGEVQNKGWEFTVNWGDKKGDFSYNIGANATFINNEVTRLAEGLPFITEAKRAHFEFTRNRIEVGQSLYSIYGFKSDGIYQSQSEIDAGPTPYGSVVTAPGDIRYKDLNGDGKITDEDRTFIGDASQDITYGMNFNLGYKGIDFNLQLQGVYGNDVFNTTKFFTQSYHRNFNMSTDVLGAWTPENNSQTQPRAIAQELTNNDLISDWWVEKASYLRVKNIQLGYSLNERTLAKLGGLNRLRLYVAGQNLWTFTNFTGLDPEVPLNGILPDGPYPMSRSFIGGIQVGF